MQLSTVRQLSLCSVCLMALGCSSLQGMLQPAPAKTPAIEAETAEMAQNRRHPLDRADLRAALAYYRRVGGMDEKTLQQELTEARQELAARNRPADQIRLAILLGLPSAAAGDFDRSIELLDAAAADADGEDHAVSDLLFLLSSVVRDMKAAAERAQALDRKIKGEKKLLEEERKQREQLQQKLEELKTIEKSLLELEPQSTP